MKYIKNEIYYNCLCNLCNWHISDFKNNFLSSLEC